MDLQRSLIKVLFYDFAPEWVAESLPVDFKLTNKHFFERTVESMKWREQRFTLSELNILKSWMEDELLNDDEIGMDKDAQYSAYERVFIPISKLGLELLDVSANHPKVKYRHLLRWRDLTLMIGEDLLTVTTLARYDTTIGNDRISFGWSNVLPHNDLKLNSILSQTLSDTHAHLNASTDVFDFNWIVVMNHPEILSILRDDKYKSRFTSLGPHQEYDTVSRYSDIKLSTLEWIEVAAALRMRILNFIFDIKNIKNVKNPNLPSLDFKDATVLNKLRNEFIGNYAMLKDHILSTQNGIKFDYAILDWAACGFICPPEKDIIKSPFMILHGERSLLYLYFKYYFGGNELARRFAPQVFLYLIIKNKIRRELTQTNSLIGFGNFKVYQDLKFMFVDLLSKKDKELKKLYQDIALRYAIQSAVMNTIPNYFEARVMPTEVDKLRNFNYQLSVFGKGNVFDKQENTPFVSLVAHFSKSAQNFEKPEGEIRHKILRNNLSKATKKLIRSFHGNTSDTIPFVGIDAAGNELSAPPEVFAQTYKKLRENGITNFTYHVGEDFYDLLHGLRSIDEAITFLNLSTSNRLGHALALGVDVQRYYEERHYCGILPKQVMLDNIVWLKYKALKWNIVLQPETQLFIEKNYEELTEELGYGQHSIYHYWESMMLRGEDTSMLNGNETMSEKWMILQSYLLSQHTFQEGEKTKIFEFPKGIWKDVCEIQERLLGKVEQDGIIIETNPSSNLKIGPFQLYSELPIFKMHVPGYGSGHHLPVTVNTDDKGVFATSLENEYSLLAISLRKQRDADGKRIWSDKEIEDYIKQFVEYGNISRFRI